MDFKQWLENAALDQGIRNPPPPIEDGGNGEDGDEWASEHWDEIRKWGHSSPDAQKVRNLAFSTLFEQPPKGLTVRKYGIQVQLDAQWKIGTNSRKWNKLMQEAQKILQYSDLWKYLGFSKHLSLDATEVVFGAIHFRYAWNDSNKDYGTTHAKFNMSYILRNPEYETKIKERLLEHERQKWEKRNQRRGPFNLRPFPYTIQNIELEFRGIDGQAQMMGWDYFWGRAVAIWNYRGLK